MRKTITFFAIAALAAFPCFAQEETANSSSDGTSYISVGGNVASGVGAYALYEYLDTPEKNRSSYIKVTLQAQFPTVTVYDNGRHEIGPKGYSFALGTRTYISKTKKMQGFYGSSELKYSTAKYDDSRFNGRYSYFSFFTPEFGWKVLFGKNKNFGIEISGGVEWAIEIKGKGNVDNKNFDNWKPKAALGLGYRIN